MEKAHYRRNQSPEDEDTFIYPYDLGAKENLKQVLNFSCAVVGDGIDWPVCDGCDEYSLTVNIFYLYSN